MSKDKYPNILSKSNGGLILCLLSFKYFCIAHSFENWEMSILGYSPVFGQETRLNQSRASENISWLIFGNIVFTRFDLVFNRNRLNLVLKKCTAK